jgi:hypothetical protein
MSRFTISITAQRGHRRAFAKEVDAEIDSPSGDLVRGRFLVLSAGQVLDLLRLKDLHLDIEGHGYRLLSVEDTGAFIAVKERED